MRLALLWTDALACSLLWIATGLAMTGRIRRKWVRVVLVPVVVGPPALLIGIYFTIAVMFRFGLNAEPSHFAGMLSLLLALILGTWIIAPRRQKGESRPTSAHWPILPLAVCLIVVGGIGYFWLWRLNVAVRDQCESLDRKIGAVYLAALPAMTSPSQNAAPLYEEAFRNLQKDDGEDVNNPPLGDATSFDPNEPATLGFLKRQAGTITLLRRAASLVACRFDSDLKTPDLATVNAAFADTVIHERLPANVLDLDALEQLARGHAGVALADADAVLKMGSQFMQRSPRFSALVGLGIDELGDDVLVRALPAVKERSELDNLHMQSLGPIGELVRQSLRGEERLGLSIYIAPPKPPKNYLTSDQWIYAPPHGLISRALFLDLDDYTKMMAKLQNLAVLPYFQARDQLPTTARGPNHVSGIYTGTLASSFSQFFVTVAEVEAENACAKAAVAMTSYRLDHGRLPEKIGQLVPKYLRSIPIDPYNGQPIRLAIKKTDWIIYTVGPNRVDDGGAWTPSKGTDDVGLTLKKSPPFAATQR